MEQSRIHAVPVQSAGSGQSVPAAHVQGSGGIHSAVEPVESTGANTSAYRQAGGTTAPVAQEDAIAQAASMGVSSGHGGTAEGGHVLGHGVNGPVPKAHKDRHTVTAADVHSGQAPQVLHSTAVGNAFVHHDPSKHFNDAYTGDKRDQR